MEEPYVDGNFSKSYVESHEATSPQNPVRKTHPAASIVSVDWVVTSPLASVRYVVTKKPAASIICANVSPIITLW